MIKDSELLNRYLKPWNHHSEKGRHEINIRDMRRDVDRKRRTVLRFSNSDEYWMRGHECGLIFQSCHFPTMRAGQISFFDGFEHLANRRETQMRPGKYVEKFFPNMDEELKNSMLQSLTIDNYEWELVSGSDISEIYKNSRGGLHSCMAYPLDYFERSVGRPYPCHPADLYALSDDFGLAVLYHKNRAKHPQPKARALVYTKQKTFTRCYGHAAMLEAQLLDADYTVAPFYGATLPVLTSREYGRHNIAILPFVDQVEIGGTIFSFSTTKVHSVPESMLQNGWEHSGTAIFGTKDREEFEGYENVVVSAGVANDQYGRAELSPLAVEAIRDTKKRARKKATAYKVAEPEQVEDAAIELPPPSPAGTVVDRRSVHQLLEVGYSRYYGTGYGDATSTEGVRHYPTTNYQTVDDTISTAEERN